MKLILMGTGPFAVPSFQKILESGYDIAVVVVRPPAISKNAKNAPPPSPVRLWALEHGLAVAEPASINDEATIAWLRTLAADLMIVCDYGQILSNDALGASRLGGINLHGSLLPRHRGAAPVQWSILAGDTVAGISVIHMTPKLDGGPVLCTRSAAIGRDDALQLEQRLSQLGVDATIEAIERLATKTSIDECVGLSKIQEAGLTTKAPRLKKEDGELFFNYPVQLIDRQHRGLQPWPGTFGTLKLDGDKELRMIVHRLRAIPLTTEQLHRIKDRSVGTALYGQTLKAIGNELPEISLGDFCIVALDGLIGIEQLQPSGKKPMSAEEFLRGYGRQSQMRFEASRTNNPLLDKMQSMTVTHA